jgi:hypothetical protein
LLHRSNFHCASNASLHGEAAHVNDMLRSRQDFDTDATRATPKGSSE